MEDGKTPRFTASFPFTIFHFPSRPAFFSGLLEVEYGVQTAMHADEGRHTPDGDQRSVHIRSRATARVVPDAQFLIGQAEDDFGADDETR